MKYIVGQGMYPAKANGTMVRSTHRRWQVVDNLDEARRLMSYWRDAQVYRLQGDNIHPLAVQPRVYHHALCDFSWYEGERPCTCEGFDSVDKGIVSGL